MVAQQEIREAHIAFTVHHGGMVMVDAIREFRRWAEVAVADIKMAECLNVDIVVDAVVARLAFLKFCLLYTSPSPRDGLLSRMPSSA